MSYQTIDDELDERASIRDVLQRPGVRLAILLGIALVCIALFLVMGLGSTWGYVLPRRVRTVATMAIVAIAIAAATILFHTVTANRILTPSIMGFDAIYLLIQTSIFFFIGSDTELPSSVAERFVGDPVWSFIGEASLMVLISVALYRWLLVDNRRSLHLLILVGVVIGILLRSISSLMQRMMAPDLFVVLQDRFFADFNSSDPRLLMAAGVVIVGVAAVLWRYRRTLDVIALGRENAISLGIDYRRAVLWILVATALLVAVATALVGPTLFFGLIVAHLAYRIMGTDRHAWTLPAAAVIGVVVLVGSQIVLERVLGFEGSISMIVEFVGGILFLLLLLRRTAR